MKMFVFLTVFISLQSICFDTPFPKYPKSEIKSLKYELEVMFFSIAYHNADLAYRVVTEYPHYTPETLEKRHKVVEESREYDTKKCEFNKKIKRIKKDYKKAVSRYYTNRNMDWSLWASH